MDDLVMIEKKAQQAKEAAAKLSILPTDAKNKALLQMAAALEKNMQEILTENRKDMEAGRAKGLSKAMLDRLLLSEERIASMAEGLRLAADLPDPVGEGLGSAYRPNGLEIQKIRVPLGVIGIIYEARPNVTADAIGLCLKSGNAVLLRGGSEAIHSNTVIAQILSRAAYAAGIPSGAIGFIETTDRRAVNAMLSLRGYLDVVIPRGGVGLIQAVVENSRVPVIETGTGICHTYVDEAADPTMAEEIAFNAKVSRPAVCNAMETLLVHEKIAEAFLPRMLQRFFEAGVQIRGCEKTMHYGGDVVLATEEDWAAEYGDYILAVRIVKNLEEAVQHIARYGTKHSETIVTNSYENARRFQHVVDAAVVYVNASTRFTDGYEFGFGAEIGISTQKLHARGPMGLRELTSTKYLVFGAGQTR